MDRTIHFGDDEADARYRIQDTSSTGGDLVLAEDLDGGTVLLEYDYSASEWVSRGPVNLSGNDITNAGSITADSLDAATIKDGASNSITDFVGGDLTISNGTLMATTSPDVRTSLNDLFIANAEQDFELGLTELNYDDGQFDVFADDSKIVSSTGVKLNLGSPLNNSGYVYLQPVGTGDISVQQNEYTGHTGRIYDVDVDSGFGYSADFDNNLVKKWDVDTMSEQGEFTGHTSFVKDVDIEGSFGYSASTGNVVKKWDVDTMSEQGTFDFHTDNVVSVAVSSNGYGYSSAEDYVLRKWDVSSMSQQASNSVGDVYDALVTDGQYVYVSYISAVVKYDADTLTEVDRQSNTDTGDNISLSNGIIYTGSSNISKIDAETFTVKSEEFTGHSSEINTVFVTDGFGYSGDFDGVVKKWDVETMTEQDEFTGHTSTVRGISFSNGYGYSGSEDETVKKWGESISASTSGNVEHKYQDIGFVPSKVVISDDLRLFPSGTDVYYDISDDQGNSVTIQRSEIDSEVDISALSSSNISMTANLERPDTDTDSPELDAWAMYLN